MYSQIDGIYFSHTAILSGQTPAFPESPTADTARSASNRIPLRPKQSSVVPSGRRHTWNNRISSTRIKREYDVFLSFRGKDTRITFTGHLHTALVQAGIKSFFDSEELSRGKTINNELERVIERSKISVVVLSRNYADSSWCLKELSKIMECRRTLGQIVIPIFYGVHPSDVRKQTGEVAKAFTRLEERLCLSVSKRKQKGKLTRWKLALTEAANCSGWDSNVIRNDAELIKKIVDDVLRKTLSEGNLHVAAYPVGIYSRAQELISSLKLGSDDHKVRFVGICGMAGMGKTTIAKAMYNIFSSQFGSNRSFLGSVRQIWDQPHRRVHLQKQLLFNILKKKIDLVDSIDKGSQVIKDTLGGKRVLVIVDDVDDRDQLNSVAGGRDWFGPGSIIIITTTNQLLLREFKVDATYMVPQMNNTESLELFSWHTFGNKKPKKEYTKLSMSVVSYCRGLPLALTVLGSFLKSMGTKSDWISELKKLEKIPHENVLEKLRISFDGLRDDKVKDIFLDISCFFVGMDMNYVQEILDGCGLYAETGLRRLLERCLITVSEKNKIMMHDLLRDMGRAIVGEK